MKRNYLTHKLVSAFALVVVGFFGLGMQPVCATSYKVLANFNPNKLSGGIYPIGGLISDAKHNIYGNTGEGGTYDLNTRPGDGVAFELTAPTKSGEKWTEASFLDFNGSGRQPQGSMTWDAIGDLYGTSSGGDTETGGIYELIPPSTKGGKWIEVLVYSFSSDCASGCDPEGQLVIDAKGKLFGTARNVVFSLTPPAQVGGPWTQRVIHSFGGVRDGVYAASGLKMDAHGNLFGTIIQGGQYGYGAVYQLSYQSGTTLNESGGWKYTIIHSFKNDGIDGTRPFGAVTIDAAGNIYGTTGEGGAGGMGTVFEIAKPTKSGGAWSEFVIHSFNFYDGNGINPYADLLIDKKGDLYGTTFQTGSNSTAGLVFELTPPTVVSRPWIEQVLHFFGSSNYDGNSPTTAALLMDNNGNLFGTTNMGGAYQGGTVYEISP